MDRILDFVFSNTLQGLIIFNFFCLIVVYGLILFLEHITKGLQWLRRRWL